MEEIWKDVFGYEDIFQISSLGRVKSLARFVKTGDGKLKKNKEKILKPSNNGNGYLYFSKRLSKTMCKHIYVHKAVALAFLPNENNCPQVNHKDANKANNNVNNLEWCTSSQNLQHAHDNGLMNVVRGVNKPGCKLTEEDIREIRRLVRSREMMQIHVADKYKVSRGYIWHIMHDKWQHIQ